MEAVPRYQVVLLQDNYTVENCDEEHTACLPVYDLNDLRFQLVTDFPGTAVVGNNRNILLAIPCDGCSDYTGTDLHNIFTSGVLGNIGHLQSANEPEQLSDDTAFAGDNYLWNFTPLLTNISYSAGDCFSLCIYKLTIDKNLLTLISSECLGTTNCFTKISDKCHTTRIQYSFNESSMGFYGSNPTLSVRLPVYLSRPQYPGEEKGYQKSDGTFLKLSERINKEWILKTEWLPDALHERIRVALSADFIQVWNENENLALEGIYRDADYTIEWHEEIDFPLAKATTTVKKDSCRFC